MIVADLHLEKASWYATHGQPLPPYDSQDILDRLSQLAAATCARAIWCLGDSFHDRDARSRITPAVETQLRMLSATYDIQWIAGNHDGLMDENWGGTVAEDLRIAGLVLRHQSETSEACPEISGHFHPKLRVQARGRSISRPCFACDERRLILPAFGSLTGGLDVRSPVMAANFSGNYHAMTVSDRRVLHFPVTRPQAETSTAAGLNATG